VLAPVVLVIAAAVRSSAAWRRWRRRDRARPVLAIAAVVRSSPTWRRRYRRGRAGH
jgi:hypothetical protein